MLLSCGGTGGTETSYCGEQKKIKQPLGKRNVKIECDNKELI